MKRFLFVLIIALTAIRAFADSPLTSTQFSSAYANLDIINKAKTSNGILNQEQMDFIFNSKNPIAHKLALINELGWDINGKDNYSLFISYLKTKGFKKTSKLSKKGSGELLICIAYIKAMDNYFEVSEAKSWASKAKLKNKESFSIQLIAALIEAQDEMSSNWCKVYSLANEVRINTSLTVDMNSEAQEIIFEYMDLYKEYCVD